IMPALNEPSGTFLPPHARASLWQVRQGLCDTWEAEPLPAGMAELADAADSKSAEGNLVGVRPPLPALSNLLSITYRTPCLSFGVGMENWPIMAHRHTGTLSHAGLFRSRSRLYVALRVIDE